LTLTVRAVSLVPCAARAAGLPSCPDAAADTACAAAAAAAAVSARRPSSCWEKDAVTSVSSCLVAASCAVASWMAGAHSYPHQDRKMDMTVSQHTTRFEWQY
jgi:hypothetical protein